MLVCTKRVGKNAEFDPRGYQTDSLFPCVHHSVKWFNVLYKKVILGGSHGKLLLSWPFFLVTTYTYDMYSN